MLGKPQKDLKPYTFASIFLPNFQAMNFLKTMVICYDDFSNN
jgi:hypothetical protein